MGPSGTSVPGVVATAPRSEPTAPDAEAEPTSAPADPPSAGRMASHRKMTLMGVAPPTGAVTPGVPDAGPMLVSAPAPVVVPAGAPSPLASAEFEPERPAATSETFAPTLETPAINPPPQPAARAAIAPEISVEEGPLETIHALEIGAAGESNGAAAEGSKPTGVAKPYVPKEAGAPPVVVEEDLLRAGQLAAEAEESAKRARLQKMRRAPTIPGTLRVQPKGAPIVVDVDTATPADFRPRRSKAPLVAVLVGSLAGAGIVAAILRDRGGEPDRAAKPEPPSVVVTDPPPPPPADTSSAAAAPGESPADVPPAQSAPAPAPEPEAAAPAVPAPKKVEARPRAPRKVAPARKPASKRPTSSTVAPASKSKPVIVRDTPF